MTGGLHWGETAAITLALELGAPLLVDDRAARVAAESFGLRVVGTVGILAEAGKRGLAPIEILLIKLAATNFRATAGLYAHARRVGRPDPVIEQ